MAIMYRFVVKRDTAANFTAANTLLLKGEFALETDTGLRKMGDGVTAWSDLAYINTDVTPEGVANLYHTAARVLATVLTGLSTATATAITAADSVLVALGKLQASKFDKTGGTISGLTEFAGTVANGQIRFTGSPGGAGEGFVYTDAAGGLRFGFFFPGSDLVAVGNRAANGNVHLRANTATAGGAGEVTTAIVKSGGLVSGADNARTCGGPGERWSVVHAGTGTINTSDAREKAVRGPLNAQELAAAQDMAAASVIYQWNESVAEKGAAARLHCGPTVQSVIAIMEAHGLDPFRYGFVCHDAWGELPEVTESWPDEFNADGELIQAGGARIAQEYRPAGDRYGLRTSELESFIAAGMAHRMDALEARLAAAGL